MEFSQEQTLKNLKYIDKWRYYSLFRQKLEKIAAVARQEFEIVEKWAEYISFSPF